jgi:hypothetical protein
MRKGMNNNIYNVDIFDENDFLIIMLFNCLKS